MRLYTLRITLFAVILVTAVLFQGCTTVSIRRENTPLVNFDFSKSVWIDDLPDSAKDGSFDDGDDVLAQMNQLFETDEAALFIGEFYDVAVKDKRTGAIFFSNPDLLQENSNASDLDKSQVSIDFFDIAETMTTLTSFPHCVNGEERNQVTVETAADHVRLTYTFGTDDSNRILCPAFTAKTYYELIEKAESMVDAEELSIMDVGQFKMGYQKIEYDVLSDSQRQNYLKQYPNLKKQGEIYILKPALTNLTKRKTDEVSRALGIDQKLIDDEIKKIGGAPDNQLASPYFVIPIEYRLDHGDLLISIDTSGIIEQTSYRLTRINLLNRMIDVTPSFDDESFLFLPDGSGSIIPGLPEKEYAVELTVPFYGSDGCFDFQKAESVSSGASFPVFGQGDGKRALFGIVESGETLSGVIAKPAGELNLKTHIFAYTQYRTFDSIDLMGMGKTQLKNVYSEPAAKSPFVIRYHFMYGEHSNYSAMARYYRAYLFKRGLLRTGLSKGSLPLDIGFIGAFSKKNMRYGFQIETTNAATTFEQADNILEQLVQEGITTPDVRYLGVLNGGLDNTLMRTANLVSVLGSAEEYRNLGTKSQLFTSVDFMTVFKKGNHLNKQKHLAHYLSKKTAMRAVFNPADGSRNTAYPAYLISPAVYNSLADSFITDYDESLTKGLFLPNVASELSSDYREGQEVNREQSKIAIKSMLEKLSGTFTIKTDGANVYSLYSADSITNIPVDSSRHKLEKTAVPFIGMVLHGHLPYTGPVINQQSDPRLALLQSLESGAGLNYLLMTEDPIIFSQTQYTGLYSLSAERWLPEMVKDYKLASESLSELSNIEIESHRRVGNIAEVRYENGNCVLINYGNHPEQLSGITVPARDYLVERGQ